MPPRQVDQAIDDLEAALRRVGSESPRVSAEWLMADVLGCRRLELMFHLPDGLTAEQQCRLAEICQRVSRCEPVQYILGETDFMGLTLGCDSRALIPRPETEWVVDQVLRDPLWSGPDPVRVIDVGTGTGCIALAVVSRHPSAHVLAVDLSEAALALAQENAVRLGLAARVRFARGDLLETAAADRADIVIANLPYIDSDDCRRLPDEVRLHEPLGALDGGQHGLELIARLVPQAQGALVPSGRLYMEIGSEQGEAVQGLLTAAGFGHVEIVPDLAGRDRLVKAVVA